MTSTTRRRARCTNATTTLRAFWNGYAGPPGSSCAGAAPTRAFAVGHVSRSPVSISQSLANSAASLPHHRALHARDQLAVGMAGDERRVGKVLRTHVTDAAIDHRQLAMVAQVHARQAAPGQSTGEHRPHVDACGAQRPGARTQTRLGTHRVEQYATAHATRGGAAQRFGDGAADLVVVHQVIQQVQLLAGRFDVASSASIEAS